MHNSQEVADDFSTYYNNSISESLENIRQMKKTLFNSPNVIRDINMELNEVYIKIKAKLSAFKLESEIIRMKKINSKMTMLRPLIVDKSFDRLSDEQDVKIITGKDYKAYKFYLNKKEELIWRCLENLSMTGKIKKNKRLLG